MIISEYDKNNFFKNNKKLNYFWKIFLHILEYQIYIVNIYIKKLSVL